MTTHPVQHQTTERPEPTGPFAWYQSFDRRGRKAFKGAFLGYGLDSYDFWVLPLGMVAIAADVQSEQAGRPACSPRPRWSSPRSAG